MKRIVVALVVLGLLPGLAFAQSLQSAMQEALLSLSQGPLKGYADRVYVIQVVNLHSKQADPQAQKIERELKQAFSLHLPNHRLVLLDEAQAGIGLNKAVFLKATYEAKGGEIQVVITASQGDSGRVLGQASSSFAETQQRQGLLAVLDIEAPQIPANQVRAYSEILRASISSSGAYEIASSADVDQLNPNQVQAVYQCTRDECATLIGQQLGVDKVMSSTIIEMGKDKYLFTVKVIEIKSGRVDFHETLSMKGPVDDLEAQIRLMASKLGGQGSLQFAQVEVKQERSPSKIAILLIESNPSQADVYIEGTHAGKTPYQNLELKANQTVSIRLEKKNHHSFRSQVTLGGGRNDLGVVQLTPNFGTLEVTSNPPGAQVRLAGEPIGTTPLSARVGAGKYLLSLELPSHRTLSNHEVQIEAGATTQKNFTLQPIYGRLVISTDPYLPGAMVLVDGKSLGVAPLVTEVLVGEHEVTIETQDQEGSTQIKVQEGQEVAVKLELAPKVKFYQEIAKALSYNLSFHLGVNGSRALGFVQFQEAFGAGLLQEQYARPVYAGSSSDTKIGKLEGTLNGWLAVYEHASGEAYRGAHLKTGGVLFQTAGAFDLFVQSGTSTYSAKGQLARTGLLLWQRMALSAPFRLDYGLLWAQNQTTLEGEPVSSVGFLDSYGEKALEEKNEFDFFVGLSLQL